MKRRSTYVVVLNSKMIKIIHVFLSNSGNDARYVLRQIQLHLILAQNMQFSWRNYCCSTKIIYRTINFARNVFFGVKAYLCQILLALSPPPNLCWVRTIRNVCCQFPSPSVRMNSIHSTNKARSTDAVYLRPWCCLPPATFRVFEPPKRLFRAGRQRSCQWTLRGPCRIFTICGGPTLPREIRAFMYDSYLHTDAVRQCAAWDMACGSDKNRHAYFQSVMLNLFTQAGVNK